MIEDSARILYERAASVRAVEGSEVNKFSQAVAILEQIANEIEAPIAITGGLAAIHHGVPVTTLDIDIVVPSNKVDDFLAAAVRHGLRIKRKSSAGWHWLVYQQNDECVDLQLVPEGGNSPRDPDYAPPNPSPRQLGVERGIGHASFAGWVVMKLVAGRDKDRYHLIEALKRAPEHHVAEVVQGLRGLHPAYLQEFERLVKAAERESQEEW